MVESGMISGKGKFIWVLLPVCIISGCGAVATRTKFYGPITRELQSGNYEAAVEKLAEARGKFDDKDRFLYYLDSGVLNFYAARYDSSIASLTLAENAAEELFTKSISRAASSLILNDNILEYPGEDYEILYANLLKALDYISLNRFDDAFVEIRRANLKLELLEQKYLGAAGILNNTSNDTSDVKFDYQAREVRFNNDAFARYLSMHIYAAEGKMDDARIDYDLMREAFETQPHIYNFEMPQVYYLAGDSTAILSVVGLTGLCPLKEALNLRIRTDKNLGLVQVLYTDSERNDVEYGHLPLPVKADYYFKFAIPKLARRPAHVNSIRIFADTAYLGEMFLLEDISKVADETFEAKKSLIYLRSIGRAVAKGLATHKLKTKVDKGGFEGWLKKAAIDVGSDVTENADLRGARFLPGKVYVGDFEMVPGVYDLRVEFLDCDGHILKTERLPGYDIQKGKLNLIKAICPE